MCGIAGVLGAGAEAETIARMTRVLAHRGPDDEGIWVDAEVALGHRRLSIVDLSPAGHQPMTSHSGRYVLTYNGEIYNHLDLRRELEADGRRIEWRGHSDTETLLAGFDAWGIKATLQRALGMFALGLWDREERTLTLARDRLGEKPLYYGRLGRGPFLFASELKALQQHPQFDPEVDREALSLFVRYLTVPAPLSIYRGVSKLLPGTMLTLRNSRSEPNIGAFWSGAEVARNGVADPLRLSPAEATDELERALDRAVARQMMADVPLGAFLSGGVDSSTVAAVMQKLSSRPIKTFTIGFHERDYNEAEHAKAVARHLGTDHTELYVTPQQAMDVIPKLPAMYDEPFADSSQIPTHLISALAREQVSVALSGDGGDELFGGYERYAITARRWSMLGVMPAPVRAVAARVLDRPGGPDKVHKAAAMLRSRSLAELYDGMLSLWRDEGMVVIGAPPIRPAAMADEGALGELSGIDRLMAQDMLGYLPNDILAKVDRASMAVSLETRVPLLDAEVVEFAWRVPLGMKVRRPVTKWLLRQVLYRHVPPQLIERPKMGFGIPLDSWMRGPLRDWAEALLDERRLREEGFFHPQEIRRAWDAHLKGCNNQFKLWTILMFQSWLEAQRGRAKTAAFARPMLAN